MDTKRVEFALVFAMLIITSGDPKQPWPHCLHQGADSALQLTCGG